MADPYKGPKARQVFKVLKALKVIKVQLVQLPRCLRRERFT